MAEARTIRPAPTGLAVGRWHEKTGDQKVEVKVDPKRDGKTEFRLDFERRWGYQLGDTTCEGFWLPREGAIELRDALTAALEWSSEEQS